MHPELAAAAALLDDSYDAIVAGRVFHALERLADGLAGLRDAGAHVWEPVRDALWPVHRLSALLAQMPLALQDARGRGAPSVFGGSATGGTTGVLADCVSDRAGGGAAVCVAGAPLRVRAPSAGALDLLYGASTPTGLSPFQFGAHSWAFDMPLARSLRARRDALTELVDGAASRRPARVLTVGAGHLREAQRSRALAAGRLERWVAVDGDVAALRLVHETYGPAGVQPLVATPEELVADRLYGAPVLDGFDLVYAAGACDGLPLDRARALTHCLFESLVPGGRLVITATAPELRDAAFLEAALGWQFHQRDESALLALTDTLDPVRLLSVRCYRDRYRNVVFLDVRRV